MKVMMVAPFDSNGRYQGGIYSIVNHLIENKNILEKYNIEVIPFNTCRKKRSSSKMGKLNFSNFINFYKIYHDSIIYIKKNNPDIVYYHSSTGFALLKDLIVIKKIKKKSKKKVILHIHFAEYEKIMTQKSLINKIIMNIIKKFVDHIVFLSENTRKQFIDKGISESKSSVIYNFSTINFSKEQIEEKFNANNNSIRFLFMGSIDERKGIFDALEVFSNIEENYEFKVCGMAPDNEKKIKFEKMQIKLGDRIKYLGYVSSEEKKDVFLNSDILILPSYGEGLPVVILEAFSSGCSVITTDVGAIPEIVSRENGVTIKPGNLDSLKSAFERYLNGNKTILRLEQKKNYEMSSKYTIEAFIKQMASVCKHVNDNEVKK